jgi:hypothetical protein
MPEFLITYTTTELIGPDYTDTQKIEVESVILSATNAEEAEEKANLLCQAVVERNPSVESASPESTAEEILNVEVTNLEDYLETLRNAGRELSKNLS